MNGYRAILLGGVSLGLLTQAALSQDAPSGVTSYYGITEQSAGQPWSAEAAMNPNYDGTVTLGTGEAPQVEPSAPVDTSSSIVAADPGEAPTGEPGVTSFYGETAKAAEQPFAAEATMNKDYTADAPAASAEAAPAEAAAEPELPMTPPGTTAYYGETAKAADQPFAAEAEMNPDYTADAPAPAEAPPAEPAAEAPAPAAAVEPELPMTPPGTTAYYGDTAKAAEQPFAAEAKMNPDYNAAEPAAAPAAAEAPAAAPAAETQQAVEACRDALNAEAQAGSILFASGKWDVLARSYKTLDNIAKVAKGCSETFVIEVGGHTDNVGSAATNKTISELRAQAVVKYLTRAGIDAGKLKAVGYGPDKPVAENGTPAGRAKNRRIEFVVSPN